MCGGPESSPSARQADKTGCDGTAEAGRPTGRAGHRWRATDRTCRVRPRLISRRDPHGDCACAGSAVACRPDAAPSPLATAAWPPRRLHTQCLGHPVAEPLHGQLSISDLGSLVVSHDPDLRTETVQQPSALSGPQRRGSCHVEPEVDPGAHLVGMLAAGSRTAAESELQLGHRDAKRGADPNRPVIVAGHA